MDPTSRSTTGTEARSDVRHYRAVEHLLDGRPVVLRAIRPDDREAIRRGFHRLSERSVYQRFFQVKKELSEKELSYLTDVDFENHVALIATLAEDAEDGIGVGRYVVDPDGGAPEVAFVVDEKHHGLGVATLLLRHLAAIARAKGQRELRALVLFDNRSMIEVFEHAGFPLRRRREGNVIELTLGLG
jgi:GNAT superfamily N-acetyltransferase